MLGYFDDLDGGIVADGGGEVGGQGHLRQAKGAVVGEVGGWTRHRLWKTGSMMCE